MLRDALAPADAWFSSVAGVSWARFETTASRREQSSEQATSPLLLPAKAEVPGAAAPGAQQRKQARPRTRLPESRLRQPQEVHSRPGWAEAEPSVDLLLPARRRRPLPKGLRRHRQPRSRYASAPCRARRHGNRDGRTPLVISGPSPAGSGLPPRSAGDRSGRACSRRTSGYAGETGRAVELSPGSARP